MAIEKRTKFLLGVGVVAVAVGGTVAFWPPSFLQEQAVGTIGAVQKHHQPQITAKDVILGSESFRREEKLVYGDLFADASKLQNISVELNMAMKDAENLASKSGSAQLGHVSQDLVNQRSEVQARYEDSASDLVAAMTLLARSENISSADRQKLESDLQGLSAAMKARASNSASMDSLNQRFVGVAAELQAVLRSRTLPAMQARIDNAFADIQARSSNASFMNATSALKSAASDLRDHDSLGISLAVRENYLQAMVEEANRLDAAQRALGVVMSSRDQNVASFNEVNNDLAMATRALEASATRNLDMRLKDQVEMSAALRDLDASLASAQKLGTRSGAALQASILADFDNGLASVQKQVQAQNQEFEQRCASSMQAEFAAIGNLLKDQEQLSMRLNSEAQAGSRNESMKQLGTRLSSSDNLAGLQNHMKAAAAALNSRDSNGVAMRVESQHELDLQARELQARIDNMVASREQN